MKKARSIRLEAKAKVAEILQGLTLKERQALERALKRMPPHRFPRDPYRATRRKIASLEAALLRESSKHDEDSETIMRRVALKRSGYKRIDSLSRREIIALYRKAFPPQNRRSNP